MLPKELHEPLRAIRRHVDDYGLDPFEVIFEMLDYQKISEVAAFGGFPVRYPHWRFGMEYDRLTKSYEYGLHRIYEMVINNNPCYAYLLSSNHMVDQKTVIAHVYGHSDFFKNNLWFSKTNRKMVDEMANHAVHIRRHIDRYGQEEVESFLDMALSLENLIDPHSPFIVRERKQEKDDNEPREPEVRKIAAKKYMDRYINPKEFLQEQKQKLEEERKKAERFPAEPVRDILAFLMLHAPLKEWQQDVLSIVRSEAYYFAPQWQTKIMNEGWATYWHSKVMTERAMEANDLIHYAKAYAGVVATDGGRFNPYKMGVELFRHIEERWNKGRFGKEYDECDSMREKLNWDRELGLGQEKIFQVRQLYNDVTFIDEFLTPEFAAEQKLFVFAHNERHERWEILTREFEKIKQKLLYQLTNSGQPFIYVVDANFQNRSELLLWHRHEGIDLDTSYSRATLQNVMNIWKRPVNLLTTMQEKPMLLRFDQSGFSSSETRITSELVETTSAP